MEFNMKIKWLTILGILSVCIGAVFFLHAGEETNKQSKYAVFNLPLTQAQKAVIQPQIDQQLARTAGGTQISSTQVSYENGTVVLTFPVPGAGNEIHSTCDYRHFCVWEHDNYAGLKVALQVMPSGTVNLPGYMTRQVSSWKYNNEIYRTVVFGVDQPDGTGRIVTSTLKEIGNGDECCPFGVSEKPAAWTEIYSIGILGAQTDKIVSIRFAPMFLSPVQ
jgi:hypothetical protein